MPERPWCCPEPRCRPIYQVKDSDYEKLTAPVPGESFFCFGMMAQPVSFTYDGVEHNNDLNSCSYTALKGVIRFQENEDDWEVLEIAYKRARQKVKDIREGERMSPCCGSPMYREGSEGLRCSECDIVAVPNLSGR